ncbi:MAG TPA: DUF1707 domain-containing protein [Jatrophihabitans sp.]|nr:DUF1707 domain-containing protein [Jatrophihabitans sp.]
MASWSVGRYEVSSRPELRIGTAERERAAAELSRHLTAGRLELDEFDERVKAAYAARTERELAVLLNDLPAAEPVRRQRRPRRRFLLAILLVAGVVALAAVAAFPPVLLIPVLFVVLRLRHQFAGATNWRQGRRAWSRSSSCGW